LGRVAVILNHLSRSDGQAWLVPALLARQARNYAMSGHDGGKPFNVINAL
jgi:hypothetical protein